MAIKLILTSDYDHMSRAAANILLPEFYQRTILEKTGYILGLATGNSPLGLYSLLALNQDRFYAPLIRTFNLDEYVGLPGNTADERAVHPESYTRFMEDNLFSRLNPRFSECNIPPALEIDPILLEKYLKATPGILELGEDKGRAIIIPGNCSNTSLKSIRVSMEDYVANIENAGGIDTWIVGVGGKGHIGFHESGIPLSHEILLVKLDENTIQNAVTDGHFRTYEEAPKYAVSMGAGGITRLSNQIMLLASGKRKAMPIARSLLEDTTSEVPISILQQFAKKDGKNALYIVDSAAAEGLTGRIKELRNRGITVEDWR